MPDTTTPIALGLDLGGTKIEAQVFGADWAVIACQRIATPRDYAALIAALTGLVDWADGIAGRALPAGIAAAGRIEPRSGRALAANLPVTGRAFPADMAGALGRRLVWLNDCRAMTLSEAVLGAGRGHGTVVGLSLGTGIGGGVAMGGRLLPLTSGVGGEWGHSAAPAPILMDHGLPVLACGCGRRGCVESYASGPGLTRLAEALTGRALTAQEIGAGRGADPQIARIWQVWLAILADLLLTLTFALDPGVVVLGGGLSRLEGLVPGLEGALSAAQLPGFAVPRIALAEGGEASGARGAAWAAVHGGADG